mmetsp:Transcript_29207/g.21740  ORF Transcript_29207/g.21740 Transcript_29207/m.21740 type:complete len:198 (-) Transcript_29207:282-875(-)|eukprot:CAMPEP_0202971684 /NCGR_PEP_ID=MMETSP1396-20130829/29633_1 /ASSEMBLY_ACC=CAM_ASM_000872 /TAXON_ID= /ORGANISM="Pseudokeronopsis sp., Strain Brazil" /LENGTH=197 /DNA_ID=CAMNT_0049701325 /DNA_START=30 /DNA_END=623 /DNA_ORIENTATION=-
MQFFLLLLAVVFAVCSATCDTYTSESSCLAGNEDGEKCSWCNSAAVGATCFKESDAKSLPSSVFQCKYQKMPLHTTACDSITKESACMSGSSNGEKCAWCNSAAVGGTCFVESDAKSLPSSVFQCEYQAVQFKASPCDSNTSKTSCLSSNEGGVKCAWCNSAAVGATCFVETDAKGLPSSVFQCEFQAAYYTNLRAN